ncbi:MAG: hypothetical protein HYR60_27285 [Acidobacteria bacterium]|nr:hypothetical protein [Acidobacteriota bacterium]MBI3471399.1 hypothetical protein [Candidatus Solibacter usitatus]
MTYRGASILAALALAFAFSALADATGKWNAEFDTQIGQQKYTFELKVDGANLTGKATSPRGTQEIKEGKAGGDDVSFVELVEIQGQPVRIEYKGKVSGDEMKLTRKVGDFGQSEAVAKRAK